MNDDNQSYLQRNRQYYLPTGLSLILGAAVYFMDQMLQTGWLLLLILPGLGLVFLIVGCRSGEKAFLIPGSLFAGFGSAVWAVMMPLRGQSIPARVGALLAGVAVGWFLLAVLARLFTLKPAWWALIPATAFAALAASFFFSNLRLVDFVLYAGLGVGVILLGSGLVAHLLGLIIPGALLLGIGPGVYLAWGTTQESSSLSRTGIMLVGFAFGWGLITLFSRVITDKFVWWPLIPGGILAMVGWGLYIGGNPDNALSFIGNTGSIALFIFGLYLLLLRRGMQG